MTYSYPPISTPNPCYVAFPLQIVEVEKDNPEAPGLRYAALDDMEAGKVISLNELKLGQPTPTPLFANSTSSGKLLFRDERNNPMPAFVQLPTNFSFQKMGVPLTPEMGVPSTTFQRPDISYREHLIEFPLEEKTPTPPLPPISEKEETLSIEIAPEVCTPAPGPAKVPTPPLPEKEVVQEPARQPTPTPSPIPEPKTESISEVISESSDDEELPVSAEPSVEQTPEPVLCLDSVQQLENPSHVTAADAQDNTSVLTTIKTYLFATEWIRSVALLVMTAVACYATPIPFLLMAPVGIAYSLWVCSQSHSNNFINLGITVAAVTGAFALPTAFFLASIVGAFAGFHAGALAHKTFTLLRF